MQELKRPRRGRQTQRVTVKEVAEAAGVSMMTVSNVIHNRANVSDALRQQVQKKIEMLGYVPNRAAQELAGTVRPHFALLYPDVINPFIAAVIVGAMKAAAQLKVDVSIQLAQIDNPKALRSSISRMTKEGLDGLILPSPIAEFVTATYGRKPLGMPAVAVAPGHPIAGMGSVRTDEVQASSELVTMLLELGHRRIGHLAGPKSQSGSVARQQGYEIALARYGMLAEPDQIVQSRSFWFQDGLHAAEELLSREPSVTAVFAANDTLAAAVLAAAQRRGISVPKQLSIVGYDDAPVAEQVWPSLTTIHQDAQRMTERAVESLTGIVAAWRKDRALTLTDDILMPYELVRRNSVAAAP